MKIGLPYYFGKGNVARAMHTVESGGYEWDFGCVAGKKKVQQWFGEPFA